MKLRAIFSYLALATACGLLTTPVRAQSIDPCTVYMCMAGISGSGASGGPGCAPALVFWHAPAPSGLAVYAYGVFVPPASAALRQSYLGSCQPGINVPTNVAWLEAIIAEWGSEP